MCSTMTTPTTQKTMFTELAELVVQEEREQLSRSSPLRVSLPFNIHTVSWSLTIMSDAKQARDLVNILTESKQNIDPRLAEMGRCSGGGGGGRGYGGRGGHRGGRGGGGGFTASNAAPLGRNRW